MSDSKLERTLLLHIKAAGISAPEREYPFAKEYGRRWRFDLAWPSIRLAVEVEGMVHRIKDRFKGDAYKYLAAQALGWTVLRFTGEMIRKGEAVRFLQGVIDGFVLHYRVPPAVVPLIDELVQLKILKPKGATK